MLEKLRKIKPSSAVSVLLLAVAVIGVFKLIMSIESVASALLNGWRYVWGLLTPFVIGGVIAYLINPMVNFFERHYGKIIKRPTPARVTSTATAYVICFAVLIIILNLLIPLMVKSTADIINSIPAYYNKLQALKESDWNNTVAGQFFISTFTTIEQELTRIISQSSFSSLNPAISGILGGVINLGGTLLDAVLGIVISVYFIVEKDLLLAGAKRICKAIFTDDTSSKISSHTKDAHIILSKFIVGKTLDSLIIGVICLVGLLIFNVRNSALFSVIVGVTNMIPYFGPFIGGIPVVLLVMFESPLKALWVAIFIFILQQFDGSILGPKILGNSINLSPFWIIFAIIIGGGLFGVTGMFLGAPALAVIMTEVNRIIDAKIAKKSCPVETTPDDTI